MGNCLLIAGILMNSALIVINRFIYKLPNRLQIPLLLMGIGLIIAGKMMMKS